MNYRVTIEEASGHFYTEVLVEADSHSDAEDIAMDLVESDPRAYDWIRFDGSPEFSHFESLGAEEEE
jgi:hypothetical protein